MNRKIILVLSQCATALSSGVVPAPKSSKRPADPRFLPGGYLDLESHDLNRSASEIAGYFDSLEDDPGLYMIDRDAKLGNATHPLANQMPRRGPHRR